MLNMNKYHIAIYHASRKVKLLKSQLGGSLHNSLIQYSRRLSHLAVLGARTRGLSLAKVTETEEAREAYVGIREKWDGRSYVATALRNVRKCARIIACAAEEGWHSEAEKSTRVRQVGWRTWGRPGALSAVHVQRADSNHGGRVFFKKLEFR